MPFVSGGVAAALTAVGLVLVFALYVAPYGVIVCGGLWVNTPQILAGNAYFDHPPTIILSVRHDGSVYVGANVVRTGELTEELRRVHRMRQQIPLELRADGKLTLAQLAPVLRSMRDAGYSEFSVFGEPTSVLQLAAAGEDG